MKQRGKVCVSIVSDTIAKMSAKAEKAIDLGADLVEFRLDSLREIDVRSASDSLSKFSDRCILTLRSKEEGGILGRSGHVRIKLLEEMSQIKPAFLDIELRTAKKFPLQLRRIRENAGKLIVSWHDFASTPGVSRLLRICRSEVSLGDLAKVVTTARTVDDNVKVLTLYKSVTQTNSDLVAFCMGWHGVVSRVLAMHLGSPINYASLPGETVAPGQLSVRTMKALMDVVGR